MNRQLSSFDIYIIAEELRELQGSYIDKIYQLSKNEILIRFRNVKTKKRENIFIRNGKLIALTDKEIDTPKRPTVFAMTLRKYLQNGIIENVNQHEFDRIIKIIISKKEGNYELIIEFFSDGNIILVDPEEKIILPLLRQAWAHRKVKGRVKYSPPPSQINPFDINYKKFKDLLKQSDKDLVRTLAVNINLSGFIAEEICIRAGISKDIKIEKINDSEIKRVYESLSKILDIIKNKKINPFIVKKNQEIIDIIPFDFITYKKFNLEKTNSFLRAFDKFIKKEKNVEKETKKESKTNDPLGKLERQIKQQKESIKKFKEIIKDKKKQGDIIYLNYQNIDKILQEIKKILDLKEKTKEIKNINEKEIVKIFDPSKNLLILNLKDSENNLFDIKINFRKSVSENAEKAYDENKKNKSKLRGAEEALKITKRNMDNLKNKIKNDEIKQKEIIEKKKNKKEKIFWFERYRWFISSNGNIVIAGRDAKTNEIIVKKYLKERDRYAHADISGAPSVVIKSKDINDKLLDIDDKTLKEACIFSASYSKAWKQFAEASSYWVKPEQVSKSAQSGEFVPKGAFIIRGKRNYQKSKLEIAIGEIEIEGIKKIMGGPVSALKKRSKKYVILNPGPITKNDLSKRLSKIFNVSSEEISKELPPGGASIIDGAGVEV